MCVIAGYTGKRTAAPILIEMLRREEGFQSGFYTGIATIDNGRLYYAKVLGDLDELLRTTDALRLPGTTGMIHSRTPSGGGREWSHPYVGNNGRLALVENGSAGIFTDTSPFTEAAQALEAKGHRFSSRVDRKVTHYPVLADGGCVHVCDIQCHVCEDNIDSGMTPLEALIAAEVDLPSEDVGVMIHADFAGTLFVARHNQPMTLARRDGEAFIATSPTAFDSSLDYIGIDLLPASAGCEITADSVRTENFSIRPNYAKLYDKMYVQPITAKVLSDGYAAVREALRTAAEPLRFGDIAGICRNVFPEGGMKQYAPLGYMIIDAMLKSGEIELVHTRVRGMNDSLTAPLTGFRTSRQ